MAVEPDERVRTRMTIELAGISPAPLASVDEVAHQLTVGEPVVVLVGPGFASDTGLALTARLSRAFPTAGVVLVADALSLPLLQQALRAGVRDVVTIDSGETRSARRSSGWASRCSRSRTAPRRSPRRRRPAG
ncbi:MAG: hypothetical protein KatS3mg009_2168 [Acidimicrobiia bacterium]|nr:MAG: hypothetical protein KatS3mg009_2168 [Acidimicrobiia bacterium]